MAITTQPVARIGSGDTVTPIQGGPVATGNVAPASTSLLSSTQQEEIAQIVQSVNPKGLTGNQIGAQILAGLENDGFTPGEVEAYEADPISGVGVWGSGPAPVAGWIADVTQPIENYLFNQQATQPLVPPSPGPITSSSTPNVPPVPPPPNSSGTPTSGTGTSTSTGSSSLTTTPNPNSIAGLLQTLLPVISGANTGGTNSTGAGDVPGTSTPISSLGALQPIANPTSTTSTGSSSLVIVVIAVAAIGGGVWLWQRHAKKKQQPGGAK